MTFLDASDPLKSYSSMPTWHSVCHASVGKMKSKQLDKSREGGKKASTTTTIRTNACCCTRSTICTDDSSFSTVESRKSMKKRQRQSRFKFEKVNKNDRMKIKVDPTKSKTNAKQHSRLRQSRHKFEKVKENDRMKIKSDHSKIKANGKRPPGLHKDKTSRRHALPRKTMHKHVSFGYVHIRMYARFLGDNPEASPDGPFLSLDWKYQVCRSVPLLQYETRRRTRRHISSCSSRDRYLRPLYGDERKKLIKMHIKCADEDIDDNIRVLKHVRCQRKKSRTMQPLNYLSSWMKPSLIDLRKWLNIIGL